MLRISLSSCICTHTHHKTTQGIDDEDDEEKISSLSSIKDNISSFSLVERIELNEMVEMLFKDSKPGERSKWNLALMVFLNASLIVYLTGTMATYSALVASTFKHLITDTIANVDSYYIFMVVTVCIGAPLSFGNFQNTKYIQIVICAARMSVYIIMVVTTATYFFQGDADDNKSSENPHPKDFDTYYMNFSGISSLYGNIVFTFMTHHSLPGLLSPIRPERHIKGVLAYSLMFCATAYIILCSFGMLAFWNAPVLDKDRCGDNSEPCRIMETYVVVVCLCVCIYSTLAIRRYQTPLPSSQIQLEFLILSLKMDRLLHRRLSTSYAHAFPFSCNYVT